MNHRSASLSRVATVLAGAVFLLFFDAASSAATAQSLEQIIQQLRQKQQEVSNFQRDRIRPKEEEIQKERADFRVTREAVEVARTGTREAQKVVRQLEAARRDIQDRQFILSFSTVELAELFKQFDQATTNEEGMRIGRLIFRARFGLNRQPPPNFTRLSDVIFQEKIKFRREAVALIGPALVGIGQVIVKMVDVRTAVLKPKNDILLQKVGPFFKPTFTHLKIWSDIIGESILPQGQLSAEAKRVSGELTRIRDQNLFGNPNGREAAIKAGVEALASVEKRLAAEKSKLERATAVLADMDAELDKARAALDEKEAELASLKEQESAMLKTVRDLQDKSQEAQTRDILRQATGRRVGLSTSIASLSDIEGLGRSGGLAVDDLTSAITGLPTRLKATIASTYMVEETIKCEECRRRSSDSDEVICTPRQVKSFRRVSIPSDSDARVIADGPAISATGRAVDGAEPGASRVFARLGSGVASTRREQSVCGPVTVIETGPPADSAPGQAVNVLKVSNLRIEGIREGQESVDLFVVGARSEGVTFRDRATLNLRADVEGPGANFFGGAIKIPPRVTGTTRGLDFFDAGTSRTNFVARDGGANAEVLYLIRDARGSTLERLRVKVTTSKIDTRAPGEELVMRERGRFAVVIDGNADTSKLSVEWASQGATENELGIEPETGFSGKQAVNEIRFDSLSLAGRTVQLRAKIKDGGVEIASVTFPPVRLIARLSDMRFVLSGSRIGVAALDIFTPAPANALPGIELQIRDLNGERVTVGRGSKLRPTLRQEGLNALRIGRNTEMNRTIEGRAVAGSTEVGSGLLVAELDLREARQSGIIFSGSEGSGGRLVENVLVTLNRLSVERREGAQGEEFVLKATGPARMTGYQALFTFADGSTQNASFESSAFGGEASVPTNGRRFVRGDVARQSGTVVGTVTAELDGEPLPPPVVTVDIPSQGRAGGAIVVRGLIQNVQHNDSFDLRCEWEVDPVLGTFRDQITSVSPTGETGGICINTLTLSDDPANLNRDVGIDLKVSRQVGGGGGS